MSDKLAGMSNTSVVLHTDLVTSVARSPAGQQLATGSADGTAKVWDAASGHEVLTLNGHKSVVSSVAWSPDGKRLVTGSLDHTATVWDAASGQEVLTLNRHKDHVDPVAWSPEGKRLSTVSGDGTVQAYAIDIYDLLKLAHARVTRDLAPEECERYFQF